MHCRVAILLLGGCELVFPLDSKPPDADGGIPISCTTKASALKEPFDGAALQPNWINFRSENSPSQIVNVTSLGLSLTPKVAGTISVSSDFAYDLVDSRFSIKVDLSAKVMGSSAVRFGLLEPGLDDLNNPGDVRSVDWTIKGDRLVPTLFEDLARVDIAQGETYDPALNHYVAISQVGGVTRWEVSNDGITFDSKYERTLPWVRFVRPYMENIRASGDPEVLSLFDDLNEGAVAEVCPAEALKAAFDVEDPVEWHRHAIDQCSIVVQGGAVVITHNEGAAGFGCEYASAGVYNLIGHSFDVAVGTTTDLLGDGDAAYLDIEGFDRTRLTLELRRSI